MNKKLLAVAVAAFVAAPAVATADTTLYGQFKYEVGFIDDGNDHNAVHSSAGTRLGVRGAEDLGGGMQAIYRFQSGFGQANGTLNAQSFRLNEEAWVGLQGGFGRVLLGRSDTAFKLANVPFRNFTDTLADLNNRPASFGRAEGVHYLSPDINGLRIAATVEPNGVKLDSYYSVAAIYRAGPLFVAAAVEGAPDDGVYQGGGKQVTADSTNWQIGVSYNFDPVTVGLLYQDIDEVVGGDGAKWITIPVSVKVTPNVTLRAAAQYRDRDYTSSMTNVALGAQYNFSSRTELYANVWNDGKTDVINRTPTTVSGNATHFGVGMRHSF